MTIIIIALVVGALGVVIGLTATGVVKRRAAHPKQAVRRSRALTVSMMLIGGVILVVDAVTSPGHRYFSIAVAVILFVAAIGVLRQIRQDRIDQ